jgi:hypothetical protein
MNITWKENWEESKKRYIKWWNGDGFLISMWEHLEKEGEPHEVIKKPTPAKSQEQFWFDPSWRAEFIHYQLSISSFKADILPVANTHLGPGSLSAILGASLQAGDNTIWIKPCEYYSDEIIFDESNKWWQLHLKLLEACCIKAKGKYYIGCPDLVEGLDTLAGLRGTEAVLTDMLLRPELLHKQLKQVNEIYFKVFDTIYNKIKVNDEMAFCYFSLWAPGKVSKLQCDISVMISEEDFITFALPYLQEQCKKIDYTLYHLDGVEAIRHLDAILEIPELKAIQWTPGEGQPQGGNPQWYNMYKKILEKGKRVMPCWVEVDELQPLFDNVGTDGLHILMHFKTEKDIDRAMNIAHKYY